MDVLLNISGLVIAFDTRFPEYVRERCRKYVVGPSVQDDVIHIRVSDEDIEKSDVNNAGRMEAELYAMTMHLSERLPMMNRLMTHGVAVSCDGKSFIFTAKSGVGKSTHAFLWQKYLGEDRVKVINGDKPILWFRGGQSEMPPRGGQSEMPSCGGQSEMPSCGGQSEMPPCGGQSEMPPCGSQSEMPSCGGRSEILACGSPWSGKERLDENICLPLGGICLLQRLENDPEGGPRIEKASREEAFDKLMEQVFLPRNPAAQVMTLRYLERLYDNVPVFRLTVDMSRESAMVSARRLLERI